MKMPRQRLAVTYACLAGMCDTMTGLLLVLAPLFTLRLMGIRALPAEPVYLRLVGAFVLSVGASYLYPMGLDPARRIVRLRTVFEVTVLVRATVALVAGACIARGLLSAGWGSVVVTDAVFAMVQLLVLRQGWLDHGH